MPEVTNKLYQHRPEKHLGHFSHSVIFIFMWSFGHLSCGHLSCGHLVIWSFVICHWSFGHLVIGQILGGNRDQILGGNRDQTKGKFNGRQPGPNLGAPWPKAVQRYLYLKNPVRTLIGLKVRFSGKIGYSDLLKKLQPT